MTVENTGLGQPSGGEPPAPTKTPNPGSTAPSAPPAEPAAPSETDFPPGGFNPAGYPAGGESGGTYGNN